MDLIQEAKKYFAGLGDLPLGEGRTWKPEVQPKDKEILFIQENCRGGRGEAHDHFIDEFFIIDGCPVFERGGRLVSPTEQSPGEWRADAIEGAEVFQLAPGKTLTVPVSIPHRRKPNGLILLRVFKIPVK